MGFDDIDSPGLVLGLGFPSSTRIKPTIKPEKLTKEAGIFEPSLTLGFSCGIYDDVAERVDLAHDHHKVLSDDGEFPGDSYRQDSAASISFSNVSVKREREEMEMERVSSRVSDEDDDGSNGRKKLRLSKVQSALLEESFKHHSTLNPKQKQDLARELNLRPRQVEVWFQNRRARTKLKQTEVDCEFLKKCCERLTDENMRLQKELQELKALKLAQPFFMQLPAATLTMCPSCEGIGRGADNASKSPFASRPHFFNRFANQSAAC